MGLPVSLAPAVTSRLLKQTVCHNHENLNGAFGLSASASVNNSHRFGPGLPLPWHECCCAERKIRSLLRILRGQCAAATISRRAQGCLRLMDRLKAHGRTMRGGNFWLI